MLSSRIADRLRQIHGRARSESADLTEPVSETPLSMGRTCHTEAGQHLVITTPLHITWPKSEETIAKWQQHIAARPLEYSSRSINRFVNSFPKRVLALDLETCGFAGNPIFLVGLLGWSAGQLVLIQHWARDYSEEKSILCALRSQLASVDALITFNGKSFDWPQVRDRFTLHHPSERVSLQAPEHLDVLHLARWRWGRQLPDCKLQTLERYICRRHRSGDIPGSRIPAAYQSYVRDGDDLFARSVLHHNATRFGHAIATDIGAFIRGWIE